MKFWKRWIADYRGKTQGLSLAEIGAYDILLDEYYAHERPLPPAKEALYRICGAFTKDEQAAVDSVVRRFFHESPDGLRNKKCDEYIADQEKYLQAQSERGKRGAASTWGKSDKDGVIHARGNGEAWWRDDDLTRAEGPKHGVSPRIGESMREYRNRIFEVINAKKATSQAPERAAGKFDD